jgi:hypothetical protein
MHSSQGKDQKVAGSNETISDVEGRGKDENASSLWETGSRDSYEKKVNNT